MSAFLGSLVPQSDGSLRRRFTHAEGGRASWHHANSAGKLNSTPLPDGSVMKIWVSSVPGT